MTGHVHPLVVTIILNHPRGWGGKPTGSHEDSRVAEISQIFGPGFLIIHAGTGRSWAARTTICQISSMMKSEIKKDKEKYMRDASMLQLVVEMGGAMLFAMGAAFTVYWNLLGKNHRLSSPQKKMEIKRKVTGVGQQVLQPAMQLNRTRYQQ